MIKIDLQEIYIREIKKDTLFCLTYLAGFGMQTHIYKTFKSFRELKQFCEDNNNTSGFDLFVNTLTEKEVNEILHPSIEAIEEFDAVYRAYAD